MNKNKIVVGGQLKKDEIQSLVLKLIPDSTVDIMSDLDAALAMQDEEYDLYLGSCDTGGGGALAMAISFLGIDKAKTVATQSSKKSYEEIAQMVEDGVVAFGFVESEVEYAVENIIKAWIKHNE
ncbi:DUF2620 family protein [Mycoplasma todarodis]|uniref:DUF2620 family protein n=1 Tax=Mycoplasma todarodis TaxID=1937191 RepID=UPI003B3982A9